MNRFLTGAAFAALLTTPAVAQDAFVLDDIVFSANFFATEAERSGAAVTVITPDDIARTEDVRVIDYLRRVPGVSVRSSGPIGTQAGITIRGVSQQNIAVRVDGIDVSDPSGTQVAFDFGSLTVGDISRIEVLRGSQGARFGSETIGGVINITTRRAERDGFSQSLSLEGGSYGTFGTSYGLSHAGDGFETNLTFSALTSDGFSAADEDNGNSEADGFHGTRLSLTGFYDIGQDLRLEIAGFAEEAEFDYDETGGACGAGSPIVCDGTPDDVTERDETGLRLAFVYAPGMVEHRLEASYFLSERRLFGTNAFGPFDFRYDGERRQVGYSAGIDLGTAGQAVIGAEQVRETYDDALRFGGAPIRQGFDTSVTSVYGEYMLPVTGDFDVAATLRYDENSEYGSFWSGRLSAVYRMDTDTTFRANLGTGYRAPSPYELFGAFVANPDLEPETSVSVDIGVERQFARGAVEATLFWVEAEDLIDFSFAAGTYVQRDGTSTRRGLELAGVVDLSEMWTLDGAYTLTTSTSDVTLDSSGWALAVPRHTLAATLTGEVHPGWTLALGGVAQADREDLDDFAVFSSTVSYEITDDVEAYLRIENIFDTEYQTIPGYGQSDRAVFVGLRAAF